MLLNVFPVVSTTWEQGRVSSSSVMPQRTNIDPLAIGRFRPFWRCLGASGVCSLGAWRERPTQDAMVVNGFQKLIPNLFHLRLWLTMQVCLSV